MPKIKAIPTPAQARVLKAFIEFPQERIIYSGYNAVWTGYQTTRLYGKPRASTIKKMISEGWLQLLDEKYNLYYILSLSGQEIAETLEPEDLISPPKLINTQTIISAIKNVHPSPFWFTVEELGMGRWYSGERRADLFAMKIQQRKVKSQNTGGGKYLEIRIFEIKISRQDWKKELDNPRKMILGKSLGNRFYFVAPEGIIKRDEVPEGTGLFEVGKEGAILKKQADWTECEKPTWKLIAAIARYWIKN